MKENDILTAFCCSDCHLYVDGDMRDKDATKVALYEGIFKTMRLMEDEGHLTFVVKK